MAGEIQHLLLPLLQILLRTLQPTAANATNQQATPTTNHPAGNPAMDQQQREANAALNQAQQERANPQVF